jgi:hypothetical protein
MSLICKFNFGELNVFVYQIMKTLLIKLQRNKSIHIFQEKSEP